MARKSHRHSKRRMHRGGSGSYSSASTYGSYVNGSGNAQYNRVFDQAGAYGRISGNDIIGAQGQNIPTTSQMPTSSQLSLIQKAGRRRRGGGLIGSVVNQALVPFTLLGLQQTYRRGKKGGRKTRRHRKH